jgi:hypothetical protein
MKRQVKTAGEKKPQFIVANLLQTHQKLACARILASRATTARIGCSRPGHAPLTRGCSIEGRHHLTGKQSFALWFGLLLLVSAPTLFLLFRRNARRTDTLAVVRCRCCRPSLCCIAQSINVVKRWLSGCCGWWPLHHPQPAFGAACVLEPRRVLRRTMPSNPL